jgi:hypothetical protein
MSQPDNQTTVPEAVQFKNEEVRFTKCQTRSTVLKLLKILLVRSERRCRWSFQRGERRGTCLPSCNLNRVNRIIIVTNTHKSMFSLPDDSQRSFEAAVP